jgi:hypothetical protein
VQRVIPRIFYLYSVPHSLIIFAYFISLLYPPRNPAPVPRPPTSASLHCAALTQSRRKPKIAGDDHQGQQAQCRWLYVTQKRPGPSPGPRKVSRHRNPNHPDFNTQSCTKNTSKDGKVGCKSSSHIESERPPARVPIIRHLDLKPSLRQAPTPESSSQDRRAQSPPSPRRSPPDPLQASPNPHAPALHRCSGQQGII